MRSSSSLPAAPRGESRDRAKDNLPRGSVPCAALRPLRYAPPPTLRSGDAARGMLCEGLRPLRPIRFTPTLTTLYRALRGGLRGSSTSLRPSSPRQSRGGWRYAGVFETLARVRRSLVPKGMLRYATAMQCGRDLPSKSRLPTANSGLSSGRSTRWPLDAASSNTRGQCALWKEQCKMCTYVVRLRVGDSKMARYGGLDERNNRSLIDPAVAPPALRSMRCTTRASASLRLRYGDWRVH